ncbi:hypothetical protein I532_16918 [Brevibacillus borstelensis AK1]|uniref:Uncharacterized protein n=1 Tax=Brevibacillus borstelensis AK1 TaxID=1300222 RepID=M8DXA8_9BACL|nr:hypothetical protein [Brevibacillus borstelensis]EMT51626.1 hypothetical protein I532_16918 [Brevibacillus borstelensis AK1]
MKCWKSKLLAATLVIGLAVPSAALAMESRSDGLSPQTKQQQEHGEHGGGHGEHYKMKRLHHSHMGVHRQMYLTLLAEKYTPESAEEWKAALAERKRLKEAYRAQKAKQQNDAGQHQEHKEAMHALKEKYRDTHKEFHAAIESGDAAKIKSVLPKLLAEVKEGNKLLAKKLEEKKN